jgi:hypothetical protein
MLRYGAIRYDMIYLLIAIGLTPGGSSTVHIYTQTIHRTTQLIWEECWPCTVFASYTLAFALQLREKARKNLSQGSRRMPVAISFLDYDLRPDDGLMKRAETCSQL